ncbi:Zn(2)-C6 fungal-type domain-containing protein [Mycena kentingensis (nom. inval.)]|nr:Zn(2)-C6 fungal-type domain-containing protein [Mycena kentingensis (nom. inval.)]
MPVDKSKPPKQGSTPQRAKAAEYIAPNIPGAGSLTHARELEVKRSRGEVSCAECRRLKIRCDRSVPCQSCVRRGCSALCPNGSLATGQGTRFVLAATEHLHRKISRMSERIRALEGALSTLHNSQGGPDRPAHPLLVDSEDFSITEEPPAARRGVLEGAADSEVPTANGDVIDAFGTLSISDHGISRFFGPTGGCESLLIANSPSPPTSASASPSSLSLSRSSQSLSPPSSHASAADSPSSQNRPGAGNSMSPTDPSASPVALFSTTAFPLTPLGPPQAIHALVASHLPPRLHADLLVESYFTQLAWLFRGVTRGQVSEMMRGVYAAYGPSTMQDPEEVEAGDPDSEDHTGPHDLALLFMVFAVGALVQPPAGSAAEDDEAHRKRIGAEAEHLHQIARAALAVQPVLEKPSIVTIQALHLLSIFNSMAAGPNDKEDSETSMEMTWSLITLASHLSQTIGLHRDSARWGLSPKMVQRRRILFWDLFVADVWTSLNTGRPPSFSLAYIDCAYPQYDGGKGQDGSFELWQFRFAAECVADVTSRTLTADTPSYTTIMELDKKVRDFPLPPVDDASSDAVGASLQRCVLEHIRETVLMYIHRSFFAQAIIEHPVNPLKSTYAPSFLAAYRASATILKSVRDQFAVMPNACARFWTMWTFAFSAAIVFGTVVTRGPRSPLATAAMTELEQACLLFSKAAAYSRRATKALPILTKLSEKARYALSAAQSDPLGGDNGGLLWNMQGVLGPTGQPVQVKKEEPDDELSIFAGHTRFVSGQLQRGSSSLQFPPPPPRPSEMHYNYDIRPPPSQLQSQQYPPPRQRLHSMPPASSLHTLSQPHNPARPTVNVNVNVQWNSRDYPHSAQPHSTHPHSAHPHSPHPHSAHPHSAHEYLGERMQHHPHAEFYTPDGSRTHHALPPPPSAPYSWPVDGFEGQHSHSQPPPPQHHPQYAMQQRHQRHQQAQQYPQGFGLAARDSRLDERWGAFMEDSGLLDGMDYRGR